MKRESRAKGCDFSNLSLGKDACAGLRTKLCSKPLTAILGTRRIAVRAERTQASPKAREAGSSSHAEVSIARPLGMTIRVRERGGSLRPPAWMRVSSSARPVSYTHLRAHETGRNLVCRLLL